MKVRFYSALCALLMGGGACLASNPPPPDDSPPQDDCKVCAGDTPSASGAQDEECEDAGGNYSPGSLEWSVNLGLASMEEPSDPLALYKGNATGLYYNAPGAPKRFSTNPVNLLKKVYGNSARRYTVRLSFAEFNIEDAADPRSLTVPEAADLAINGTTYSEGFLDGEMPAQPPSPPTTFPTTYATITSDTLVATITYQQDGYDIEIDSLLKNTVPEVRVYEVRLNTTTQGGNDVATLTINDTRTVGSTSVVRDTIFEQTMDPSASGGPVEMVVTSKIGSQDWRKETLTYSNVVDSYDSGTQEHGWPESWTVTREIEERSDVLNGTSLTVSQTGAYQLISKTKEDYVQMPLDGEPRSIHSRRLVEVESGDIGGSGRTKTTTVDYYDGDDTDPYEYGRLKQISRPDGSWKYFDYSGDDSSTMHTVTEYSSYKDVTVANKANARKVVRQVSAGDIVEKTYLAGVKVEDHKYVYSDQNGKRVVRYRYAGSTSDYVREDREYNPVGSNPLTSGRLKSVQHEDGTETLYSYAQPNYGYSDGGGIGGYEVTRDTGELDSGQIANGRREVETYNEAGHLVRYSEAAIITDQQNGRQVITMTSWKATAIDELGRPTQIEYDGNSSDAETREYSCCGLAEVTKRDGSKIIYGHNAAREVVSEQLIRASGVTPVYTITLHEGTTTTRTKRTSTDTLFLSKVERDLSGDVIKRWGPDRQTTGTGAAQAAFQTSYSYSYPADSGHSGGGIETTITYPDSSTSVTTTFLDGRADTVSGTAEHDRSHTYGTHTAYGGGGTKTSVSPVMPNNTQETTKYYDRLGRLVRTEHADGSYSSRSYNNTSSVDAGARGKLDTFKDEDENDTAGAGVSRVYTYHADGGVATISEETAGGTKKTTILEDAVGGSTSGIGNAWRTRTYVEGIGSEAVAETLVSTEYESGDGFSSKTVDLSGTATSIVNRTPPVDGDWTVKNTNRDGSYSETVFVDGLVVTDGGYDANDGLIDKKDFDHDDFGRITKIVDPRTATISYTMDSSGNMVAAGAVPAYTEAGSRLGEYDPASGATTYAYDKMGRRTEVDRPNTDDAEGNPIPNTTYTSYTPTGLVRARWGDQVYPTFRVYDELGRMTELHTWQTAPGLSQSTTTPPTGSAETGWIYDSERNWLIEKNYPGDNEDGISDPDYAYTPAGRLKTRRWERLFGRYVLAPLVTTYGYDAGQLETVTYNDDTPDVTHTYDALGRRDATVQTDQSKIEYDYDLPTARPDSETISYDLDGDGAWDFTRTLERHRDQYLRLDGLELKDGSSPDYAASYGYDAAGRIKHADPSFPLPSTPDFSYGYLADSGGLISTVTGPAHTVTNSWEPNRDVLDKKENKIGGTVFSSYDYTVNAIGQREGMVYDGTAHGGGDGAFAYGYNAHGEVVEADRGPNAQYPSIGSPTHTWDYGFDAIGNRDTVTTTGNGSVGDGNYTANAENQYTDIDWLNPSYDVDGNATGYPVPADPGASATLGWDAENRLISSTANGSTTTYGYDHLGRRIVKTSGGTTVLTIYDGWNPVADYTVTEDGENEGEFIATPDRTYLWGKDLSGTMQGAGGVGGLLALWDESADGDPVSYPCYDGNGNVTEYIDSAGALEARFTYDPFGNTIADTDTAEKFDIRFSTKRRDIETGLYYYGYRYYDPVTGRWPSRDPIEEYGGVNLYGFVINEPVSWVDLIGLRPGVHPIDDGWGPGVVPPPNGGYDRADRMRELEEEKEEREKEKLEEQEKEKRCCEEKGGEWVTWEECYGEDANDIDMLDLDEDVAGAIGVSSMTGIVMSPSSKTAVKVAGRILLIPGTAILGWNTGNWIEDEIADKKEICCKNGGELH